MRLILSGGIFSILVICSGLIGLIVIIMQFVLIEKRNLWPAIIGSTAGTGLLGFLIGLICIIKYAEFFEMVWPGTSMTSLYVAIFQSSVFLGLSTTAFYIAVFQSLLGSIASALTFSIQSKRRNVAE